MKIITFAVPCYNSSGYMRKCIESILPGGDDIEIIIVDDGSSDNTLEIAKEYEKKYPTIVRAIHQDNKGHGGAVNTGLEAAEGVFFKVVDSDDWLDKKTLPKVIDILKKQIRAGSLVDMLLTNYMYDKEGKTHHRRMIYSFMFEENVRTSWECMKHQSKGFYILMHSVTYRTEMLREKCNLELPEHTFYVDNLFVYLPLPYVRNIYYLNETFYHYYIGREGQSVQEATMIKRLDQQLRVNKLMYEAYNVYEFENKHLRNYMLNYLEMVTCVSTVMAYRSKDKDNLRKIKRLWKEFKDENPKMWRRLRYGIFGFVLNIPSPLGRRVSMRIYKVAQKVIGFN